MASVTDPAELSAPWPATNDKAPVCSWWSGPGLLYALLRDLWGTVGCFRAREHKDTAKSQNAVLGLQMAFTTVLCFWMLSALLDMGAKMPPAGRRGPHKRREYAGAKQVKENPPQKTRGGKRQRSSSFCRLADNHKRKK